MNEQTNQLIRELAEKLGTTSEYLWQVLIEQAPISAIVSVVSYGILLALCTVIIVKMYRLITKDDGRRDDDWQFGVAIITASVVMVLAVCLACELPMIIAGLFNPEYWALKQILK